MKSPDGGTLRADVTEILVAEGHGEDTLRKENRCKMMQNDAKCLQMLFAGQRFLELRLLTSFITHLSLIDTFCAFNLHRPKMSLPVLRKVCLFQGH